MNAQAPALTLSPDLLTGAEWTAAHVRELYRLTADIKAQPDRYTHALVDYREIDRAKLLERVRMVQSPVRSSRTKGDSLAGTF